MTTKIVRNDISHVPTWQLKDLLEAYLGEMGVSARDKNEDWDMGTWAESNGLDPRQLTRIFRLETQTSGLSIADKVCHAIGGPQVLHSLTFIPGPYANDPIKMAREEYLAEFDEDPPQDFLSRR